MDEEPEVVADVAWDDDVLAWGGGEPVLADDDVAQLVAAAVGAAFEDLGATLPGEVELGVTFVGEPRIRELNREHRSLDVPTDVLSFPIDSPEEELPPGMPLHLGDVVVCPAYVEGQVGAGTTMVPAGPGQEAGDATLPAAIERCVVHGVLHLCGYDHELGDAEARAMFDLEQLVLDAVRGDGGGSAPAP